MFLRIRGALLALLSVSQSAWGDIPAYASNTPDAAAVSVNEQLQLASGPSPSLNSTTWTPINLTRLDNGSEIDIKPSGAVSFFFDNTNISNITTGGRTLPPWIAFISCDVNVTANASSGDSLVNLAGTGVAAIILYSKELATCVLSPTYRNTAAYLKRVNIYTVLTKDRYAYSMISRIVQAYAGSFPVDRFDPDSLMTNADQINAAVTSGHPEKNTFVLATIAVPPSSARNSTSGSSVSNGGSPGSHDGLDPVSVKIIIGSVCGAFLLILGAVVIRAYTKPRRRIESAQPRNPPSETSGPGMTQAVLNTFTLLQYRSPDPGLTSDEGTSLQGQGSINNLVDENATPPPYEAYPALPMTTPNEGRSSDHDFSATMGNVPSPAPSPVYHVNTLATQFGTSITAPSPGSSETTTLSRSPPSIGYDTCALCIGAFMTDEQLRVLPCSGRHQFHRACVDPWLLDISASCPLCRQDFSALERSLLRAEVGRS